MDREPHDLELSLGMSVDFDVTIARGAPSVQVSLTIVGQHDYSNLKIYD